MSIFYYRLNPLLALRGYSDKPRLLIRYGEPWSAPISENFMEFLKRCDGETPFDTDLMFQAEKDAVQVCLENNTILQSDTPDPIAPRQRFRAYPHTRRYIAQWSITDRCNLRCRHCFVMSMNAEKQRREIGMPEVERIVDQLAGYGVETVMLTGGEPLLHPLFLQIVQKILDAGMTVNWINTNGMLLTSQTLDRLTEMGVRPMIAISFDGFGTHDWMRSCPGAEEKALAAIRLCGEKKVYLRACVNVNRKTLPGLVGTVKELVKLGINEVFLLRTTEAPRWASTLREAPNLGLGLEEFIALIPDITRQLLPELREGLLIKYFGIQNVDRSLTPELLMRKIPEPADRCSAWCRKTSMGVFISSDGYIVPCDGIEGGARDVGALTDEVNILKTDLSSILSSRTFCAFGMDRTAEDIRSKVPKCRDCESWDICHGGKCRVNALIDGFREKGSYAPGDALRCDVGACIFTSKGYRAQLAEVLKEL